MTTTPQTLSAAESEKLLKALLFEEGTPKQKMRGIRNYLMAVLMLDAGVRVGELVQFYVDDLVFNSLPVTSIIIRPEIAKNHKERRIPTSHTLCEAIRDMQGGFWSGQYTFDYAYAFHYRLTSIHLSTRQVERIITNATMKSIGRPVHPHVLRHTFASRLMRTTNLRVVQELLGHVNITSTQVYTHPNSDDLVKAIVKMDLLNHQEVPEKLREDLTDTGPNRGDARGADHNHS